MTDQPDHAAFERWQRVKEVFSQALERQPAERVAFLDEACGMGDPAVRREVEALLAAHLESDSFLETPSAALSAPPIQSHSELTEGQTLGPYRVLRPLGRGGMATVYLARDERHHRSVALKVLHPDLAHALGAERFLREIEVAANLTHPHILPLHDSGEAEGRLYYVMPYVEGESLRECLTRETQLAVEPALQIAREVADALAYAHGQGVIHRDIKPENILLSGGHALVADFGIARALGRAGEAHLTDAGMALGTAAYMSPEQARGAPHLDGRSDVYSLGCVVYEMLAGEPPYTGPTAEAIIAKRFSDPVPRVRRVRPSIPVQVEQAVTRALATVPADRFATAAEFAQALATPAARAAAPAAAVRATAVRSTRRSLTLGLAAALGLAVAVGGVLWQRSQGGGGTNGPTRLAVLPFENQGMPQDEYFADGLTDAVRGKLSALPTLQVIARQSSAEYKNTPKTLKQIGHELGVQYLLMATVRWEKRGGANRVQVSPELIQVATASTRWQRPFNAEMADVFQVQADIAGLVARALDVELGAGNRQSLDARPTTNLQAYDLYLQADQLGLSQGNPGATRRAIQLYEQAVALDTAFALAWAGLSMARAQLYINVTTHPAGVAAAARAAATRALALTPKSAEARRAMANYYQWIENDPPRAAEQYAQGLRLAPNDAKLLVEAAQVEASLGRWKEALAHSQRAFLLDPRAKRVARIHGFLLLWVRRYPEARAVCDEALVLASSDLRVIEQRAMVDLAQGDLTAAQRVLGATREGIDPATRAAYIAEYFDLGWALDDAGQRLVLSRSSADFSDDQLSWGLALAQVHAFRGDARQAGAYADSARIAAETALRTSPNDPQLHSLHGVALAYSGRRNEAVKEGQRGVALLPISKDAYFGAYIQHQLARIYILVGEYDDALDQLEPLLKIPYYLSPGWLRIDPTFAPLRGNPRFERLLEGKT
jgi:eukaryotic-like serine/threonine-protein kinase